MDPRVTTSNGVLVGFEQDGVFKFYGIPYAAPPVGDRRWRPPAAPEVWTGEREARSFGSACLQTVGAISPMRTTRQSEDCLFLNIWTASLDPSVRLPVMVWIHGGGNLGGAGSEEATDGSRLAAKGVVAVTFNYRLGAFGFLAHPNLGANFGVLDQVAALRWVRDNIASFGGDPANVTVFGQSAGAVAVRTLLSCPPAQGLFHRGIMESGGFEAPAFAPGWSYARASIAAERLFDRLGSHDPHTLRSADGTELKAASHELSGIVPESDKIHTPADLVWMPVIDGKSVIAGDVPSWADDVPLLLGCVENEARYFIKPGRAYSRDKLVTMAKSLCGPRADEAVAGFDRAGLQPYPALDKLFTAAIWAEPALETVLRFTALSRRVHYYHFARLSPGAIATQDLAKHSAEIRYVFGDLTDDGAYDATDRKVSDLLQNAWIAFATCGVPEAPSGLEWPQYETAEPLCAWIQDAITVRPFPLTEIVTVINTLRAPVDEAELRQTS